MPSPTEKLLRAAGAALAAGRPAEAEVLIRRALAAEPTNPQAHLLLGVLAGKTGRDDLAFEHLKIVVAAAPERVEALFWLSMLHRRRKEIGEATRYAQRAAKVRREDPQLQNNLGLCYLDENRLEDAVAAFQQAIAIRSDVAQFHHNLGTALHLLGRDTLAAESFDRALAVKSESVDSLLSLGQTMISMSNPRQAAEYARRAIAMAPNLATAHLLLAGALVEDLQAEEAEAHVRTAIALNPRDAEAHAQLGMRMQSLGNFDEANEHLRRSIELKPKQGFAYFAYMQTNKVSETDRPMIDTMENLVAGERLPPKELSFLHYGLGRALETLGDYEHALGHFDEANRISRKLKFGDAIFDRAGYAANYDRHIRMFDREFMERNAGRGDPSDLPILIVGMMRSGTTLAEHILSAHPMVAAGGEQRFWPVSRSAMFGGGTGHFNPGLLPDFARRYLEVLHTIGPNAARVTDKLPANFEILGPNHLALPNARIIHMRRHPVDTCISIYTTPNRTPISYAYDRDNIVFAYEQYARLMDHWRSVLPPDRFLEVRYEDLVADREAEARRMLDFVGLEWDDALLHHERTERHVLTPSLWQVRQPIYTSSVERWRRYEPWLGPFQKLLRYE